MKAWIKKFLVAPLLHPAESCSGRRIKDSVNRIVIDIYSTTNNSKETNWIVGVISPVEADILGKVISGYVTSDQFKIDWARIAEKHLTE